MTKEMSSVCQLPTEISIKMARVPNKTQAGFPDLQTICKDLPLRLLGVKLSPHRDRTQQVKIKT